MKRRSDIPKMNGTAFTRYAIPDEYKTIVGPIECGPEPSDLQFKSILLAALIVFTVGGATLLVAKIFLGLI
jgi:hypothetical protein